jgi:alpha-amylase
MQKFISSIIAVMVFGLFGLFGCGTKGKSDTSQQGTATISDAPASGYKIVVPAWAKNSTIYEVNIRQFTPEGTFRAIVPHLERLAKMGVDILWLMPIHPISETKRKGTLGSYYAVNGFREVNPEYGTQHDLQYLISTAHNNGLKVIIDWVPHHTGWDHPWITEHPDWYSHDSEGNIIDPINEETGEPWGWTDVAELDLSNQEMRKEMISDMIYWIESSGVDGFRVDHAHGLPDDYWNQVSDALARLNQPIFMLAEGEDARLRNNENFVATYAWEFHHAMNDIANGKKDVNRLDDVLAKYRKEFKRGYHIYFTSNHDENSWAGTVMERMGDGHKTFAVLAATIDGMPLIYSGQEAPLKKRLMFFEKDQIDWDSYAYADFYKTLFHLKKRNKALWNGDDGGLSKRINKSKTVYAFKREKDGDKIVVIINLSDKEQKTTLTEEVEEMRNAFERKTITYASGEEIVLAPWEYIVLSNK